MVAGRCSSRSLRAAYRREGDGDEGDEKGWNERADQYTSRAVGSGKASCMFQVTWLHSRYQVRESPSTVVQRMERELASPSLGEGRSRDPSRSSPSARRARRFSSSSSNTSSQFMTCSGAPFHLSARPLSQASRSEASPFPLLAGEGALKSCDTGRLKGWTAGWLTMC